MPRTNLSSQFTPEQRKTFAPKIVQRNTFKFTRDGETVIRLHGTDIVRRLADGSVILNSGGWKTVTTKDRMNNNLPGGARIIQEKGVWYVSQGAWNGPRVPYFDGIQVPQCFAKPSKTGAKVQTAELKQRLT